MFLASSSISLTTSRACIWSGSSALTGQTLAASSSSSRFLSMIGSSSGVGGLRMVVPVISIVANFASSVTSMLHLRCRGSQDGCPSHFHSSKLRFLSYLNAPVDHHFLLLRLHAPVEAGGVGGVQAQAELLPLLDPLHQLLQLALHHLLHDGAAGPEPRAGEVDLPQLPLRLLRGGRGGDRDPAGVVHVLKELRPGLLLVQLCHRRGQLDLRFHR